MRTDGNGAGPRTRQIFTGLGAGNIGDELMARAFWRACPPSIALEVVLDAESRRQRAPYPAPHRYVIRPHTACPPAHAGLIVGTTPVTESEGLGWPLEFLSDELREWHKRGAPVDALGVGVDALTSRRALRLFREAFLPVRSWTVRSPRCRDALTAMGVPPDRVEVGADWAWLHVPADRLETWAAEVWRSLGVDPSRPLMVVNVVNLQWRRAKTKRQMAAALDACAARFDLQIAFFCNESRDGRHYDFAAAADVARHLRHPYAIVPNAYYSPDETLSLLRFASVTVGQRYHFVLQSILAGVAPVAVVRGQKMLGLVEDTGTPVSGTVDAVDAAHLANTIGGVVAEPARWTPLLSAVRDRMAARARRNFAFWPIA